MCISYQPERDVKRSRLRGMMSRAVAANTRADSVGRRSTVFSVALAAYRSGAVASRLAAPRAGAGDPAVGPGVAPGPAKGSPPRTGLAASVHATRPRSMRRLLGLHQQ